MPSSDLVKIARLENCELASQGSCLCGLLYILTFVGQLCATRCSIFAEGDNQIEYVQIILRQDMC